MMQRIMMDVITIWSWKRWEARMIKRDSCEDTGQLPKHITLTKGWYADMI
ncbi:MAG: hypothetical protein HFI02_15515 [Lachnospiraceae bacterium]|nr:hypothetical protein [Lachnospiraceae bacterium]